MSDHPGTTPGAVRKGAQPPFLRFLAGIVLLLDWSGRLLAAMTLGVMFLALLANVILRYAFGSGIAWAYEIHALLLPWLVGAGIVIAAARHRHIAVTLLPGALPSRERRILLVGIQMALFVIVISVLWSSQPILRASQFQTLSTLGIKQIWGYASLVYAFASMAVISLVEVVSLVSGARLAVDNPAYDSLS